MRILDQVKYKLNQHHHQDNERVPLPDKSTDLPVDRYMMHIIFYKPKKKIININCGKVKDSHEINIWLKNSEYIQNGPEGLLSLSTPDFMCNMVYM